MCPHYPDSVASQAAAWNKEFEMILMLQFSALRETGKGVIVL